MLCKAAGINGISQFRLEFLIYAPYRDTPMVENQSYWAGRPAAGDSSREESYWTKSYCAMDISVRAGSLDLLATGFCGKTCTDKFDAVVKSGSSCRLSWRYTHVRQWPRATCA